MKSKQFDEIHPEQLDEIEGLEAVLEHQILKNEKLENNVYSRILGKSIFDSFFRQISETLTMLFVTELS